MPAVMRPSRHVVGLSSSTATTPPAPAPAIIENATEKKTLFRRTAACAATAPKRVVKSKKYRIEAILEDNQGPAKRTRPLSKNTSFGTKRDTRGRWEYRNSSCSNPGRPRQLNLFHTNSRR